MFRRVRTKAALATGSAVAVCFVVFGTVCSVDRAGLSNVDGSVSAGGSGGSVAAAGGTNGTGGTLGGSGGSGTGGTASGGSGGANLAGGSGGAAGSAGGSGGTVGLGGANGTGGDNSGTGGDGSGGNLGTGGDTSGTGGGSGGDTGTGGGSGGDTATGGGSGGDTSTGGGQGSGGAAGAGTGGAAGTMGSGGTVGSGGAGGSHPPSCSSFPTGSTLTPPNESVLHCYWAHADTANWETAEATCEQEGGTLATILSSQENMAVLQLATRNMLFAGLAVVWLGANDGKQSNDKSGAGQYAWVTGEAWGYTNWHAMQPDGSCMCQLTSSCSCAHWLAVASDGTWHDRADSDLPYVCEAVAR